MCMDDEEEELNPEEAEHQQYYAAAMNQAAQAAMNQQQNMEAHSKASSDQSILSLEKLTQLISTNTRTPEELKLEFTDVQLQSFRDLADAPLDDKTILENDLTKTHKPMALLNTLKQKERDDFQIEESSVQQADPFFGAGAQNSLWYTQIRINKAQVGEGIC